MLGTLSELVVFALIGASARLHGIRGHRALFAAYALSMITSNTAHTATQGLIPDLVPADQHGRFSGVKVLLELPFPLVFVSLVVGRLVSGGSLWGALLALMGVLVVCMLATLFVPEVPLEKAPPAIDWRPFVRLLIVTGAFTAIILSVGAGVNKLMQVLLVPSGASGTLPTALVGLAGMVVAVLVGVWASVRISLGEEASDASSFTWWVVNWLTFLVATAGMSGFYAIFPAGALREPSGRSRRRASIHPDDARGHLLVDGCCARRLAGRSCREEAAALGERRAGYSRNPGRGRRAEPGGSIRRRVPDRCLDRAVLLCERWALGTEIVPKEQAGRYLGLSNLAGAGAGAIGAYIGGPIADHVGYAAQFAIYSMLFLLSALALTGIREGRTQSVRGAQPVRL